MARAVFNDNNGRTRRVFDFIESGKNGEIFRDGIEYFSLYRGKLQSFRKSRSTSISSRCSTHEPRRWVGANPSIEPSLADQENDPPSLIIDAARSMDRACARANSAAAAAVAAVACDYRDFTSGSRGSRRDKSSSTRFVELAFSAFSNRCSVIY